MKEQTLSTIFILKVCKRQAGVKYTLKLHFWSHWTNVDRDKCNMNCLWSGTCWRHSLRGDVVSKHKLTWCVFTSRQLVGERTMSRYLRFQGAPWAPHLSIVYLRFLCPALSFPHLPASLEVTRDDGATETFLQNFFSTSSSSSSRSSSSFMSKRSARITG